KMEMTFSYGGRCSLEKGVWNWRIPPRGRALDDVSSLNFLIGDLFSSSEGYDTWQWSLDAFDVLKVKTQSNLIQDEFLAGSIIGNHHTWNFCVPK
ncbi:hypothetical protein Tco_1560174, partial [Tanacetum coccineum]